MKLSVRRQHGPKRPLVRGLGASPCDKPPRTPGLCSTSLGGSRCTSPPELHWGPCSVGGKVCGGLMQRRLAEGIGGPFPPTEHLALPRRFMHDAGTAQRGYFLLICPLRGSTFFYFAQKCCVGEQHPRWSGNLEKMGWRSPGALTWTDTLCTRRSRSPHTALGGQLCDNRDPGQCPACCRCPGNERAGSISELQQ